MLEVCRRRLSSGIPGACHCPDLSSLTFHPAPPTPTLLTWVAAAAVSKSLQSCLTLCDPIDTRLLCPWDSPCKNTGVGCHFLLQCMKVKSQSEVAQSCLTLSNTWTAAYQAPPSMGFSRQEYWNGLPLPYPIKSLKAGPLIPDGCHIADVQYLLNELSCLEIITFASPSWCGYWTCYHVWALVCGVGDGWTGRPGVLQFMGSQRVGHDWATELNW